MSQRPARVGKSGAFFAALYGVTLGAAFYATDASAQQEPKPRRASIAYFGDNVTNPGVSLGYEGAFWFRRPHELFGGAHVGGYRAPDSGYGLFIYIEGGYRLNFNVGFFLEARVGLGYVNVSRGSVITNDDGSMSQGPNVSTNYLTPLGMGGLGWDFMPRTRVPISLFADVGGIGRYSATEGFNGGLVFTSGLAYQFGTTRPRMATTPVPPTPPPVAPSNLDDPSLPPGVVNEAPPMPPPPPIEPTGPMGPDGPIAPTQPVVPPPAPRPKQPEPPQLPPPPTVPGN